MMRNGGRFLIAATLAAVWVTIAHGGAFNACRVTYDYDGTVLINGERFFPVGNYFLPQGYPENQGIPTLPQAYEAFAANGGNLLINPRYFHMLPGAPDRYGVHYLPSDLYYGETECVDHLDAADPYGVKLMTGRHIFWWWDEDYRNKKYPGKHPIGGEIAGQWGWPINIAPGITQEERFSGMEPNGGIKGWVENGASGAFMGWEHWPETAWVYWIHRFYPVPRPYPEPPNPEPTPDNIQITYADLKVLEGAPGVDAAHATFCFQHMMVRHQDLWRMYNEATDIVAINVGFVPEPYVMWYKDNIDTMAGGAWLPNYHIAASGDAIDAIFETTDGTKPVISIVQNHTSYYYENSNRIGGEPTESQYRFMTYDSIIHRANGITYGVQSFGTLYTGEWLIFEQIWDPCKPTFNEIGQNGLMHEALKAEHDNLLVEVITKKQGIEVERSAFVGGELAPKNHFLSANILMEGCAKKYGGYTYLIVACREGIDQWAPPPNIPYAVTFRPYFSNKTTWTGTVEVVGEEGPGGEPRTINIVNGAFTDNFFPEEVHIYKLERPSPFAPPE
jgi:hypothetical protein